MTQNEQKLAADVLMGTQAIADFTGVARQKIQYLMRRGLLPGGRIGRSWVVSKTRLREHYDRLTAGERVLWLRFGCTSPGSVAQKKTAPLTRRCLYSTPPPAGLDKDAKPSSNLARGRQSARGNFARCLLSRI